MSLPGCGTGLAGSSKKERIAYESGVKSVNLARRNILPRTIMSEKAFENAIMVDMAIGGSTNTVLQLMAIAHEARADIKLELFDRISRSTPHITNLRPGGEYFMEDLEYAGGIPAVMKRLRQTLNNVTTVSDKTINQIAADAEIFNDDVIRPLKDPYHAEGGIFILKGNLAPEGAVVYQHWLGWHYAYHLFDAPVYLAYWPTPARMARDVLTFGGGEPRYVTFPSWESSARVERALAGVGYGWEPVLTTTRRDGTLSFTVYHFQPLADQ